MFGSELGSLVSVYNEHAYRGRPSSKLFTSVNWFFLTNVHEIVAFIISTLQIGKLQHRENKEHFFLNDGSLKYYLCMQDLNNFTSQYFVVLILQWHLKTSCPRFMSFLNTALLRCNSYTMKSLPVWVPLSDGFSQRGQL